MKRKIIEIDETKCDGCGKCIDACHEGALALVNGKAKCVKDSFCDGLGTCSGDCPRGALSITEREAPEFDNAAVQAAQRSAGEPAVQGRAHLGHVAHHAHGGCPGSALRTLDGSPPAEASSQTDPPPPSSLGHWPIQLMLVPPHAPFLKGADLVVCADCAPFAVPDFHARYLAGRAVVIGCPKLDDLPLYSDKLATMVREAHPRRLTVVRMEVPCCRGIAQAAIQAALSSGFDDFPVEEHIVGVRGGVERTVVRKSSANTPTSR